MQKKINYTTGEQKSPSTRGIIDLNFSAVAGEKKIKFFRLALPKDLTEYETLLNNPDVTIYKDLFSYDKIGQPVTTCWFIQKN